MNFNKDAFTVSENGSSPVFRLAPEILKWMDRNGKRGHELAVQDNALEFEQIRGAQRIAETGAIDALKDATRTQGEKTGVRWVDALPPSVRPIITY